MTCRWVFYFIPQYRVVEPLVLSVCIGAIFSVPYSVITVLIVAFMMGYTCVCVCCVGWSLFCPVLWHVQHATLLLLVGSKVKEVSVISLLYTARTALYTFLGPQLLRVKIFRSVYAYSPSRVRISIDLPTTVFLRPVQLYTNADCR